MVKKSPKVRPKEKSQSKKFAETAKKIGVDETGKTFESAFKKIVPPRKDK